MEGEKDIKKQSVFALKEQLARQSGLLANTSLIGRLPDKGAKIRSSIEQIENELERRKTEVSKKPAKLKVTTEDLQRLEWSGGQDPASALVAMCQEESGGNFEESDDSVEEEGTGHVLKLLATSQISQRQEKIVVDHRKQSNFEVKPDPYFAKLVEKDIKKSGHDEGKFVPAKSLKKSHLDRSQASSSSEHSATSSNKWDEALLPPKGNYDQAKILSMEDTMKISCEKFKDVKVKEATEPPKKTYAYDKLVQQGVLGTYNVAMQTSRPVRTDVDDLEEGDLSHDSITDDSDPECESETDDIRRTSSKDSKTSGDLSNLINANMKIG